jgi:hypothetical protein
MSEKNLNIRNQFANKIINKIEKLNNDIKLLAKVDKKLSNGNNQIGGSPSIQENIRNAQFAVAKARLAIDNNQPKINSIAGINQLNKASNQQLTEAATSLGVINGAISELSTAIDSLIISDIPDLTQINPRLAENFKTIIGNEKTLNDMNMAINIMRQVQELKIEYNRQYTYFRQQVGILNPLKTEFIRFTVKKDLIDEVDRTYPLAYQYYQNKQTEFNNDFKPSEIYVELNGYKEMYKNATRNDIAVFMQELNDYNTKYEAYNATLQLLVDDQALIVQQYINDRKAALAAGAGAGTALPDYPVLPIYTGMEYEATELTRMQIAYNTKIDTYYNDISNYEVAFAAHQAALAAHTADAAAYTAGTLLVDPGAPPPPPPEPVAPNIPTLLEFGSGAVNIAYQAYLRKIDTATGQTYQLIWDNYNAAVAAYDIALAAHSAAVAAYAAALAAHPAELATHAAAALAHAADTSLPDPGAPPPAPVDPGAPPPAPAFPTIDNFDPTIYGPDSPIHITSLDTITANGIDAIPPYANFSPELQAMFTNEAYEYCFPSNEIQFWLHDAYNAFQFKHDEYLSDKTITDDRFSSLDITNAIEHSFSNLRDNYSYETIENMEEAYPHISAELRRLFPSNDNYRTFLINFKYI